MPFIMLSVDISDLWKIRTLIDYDDSMGDVTSHNKDHIFIWDVQVSSDIAVLTCEIDFLCYYNLLDNVKMLRFPDTASSRNQQPRTGKTKAEEK